MKTKNFIIISIIAGFLVSSTLFAGNNLSSYVLSLRYQLKESLNNHPEVSTEMNNNEVDVALKVEENGDVNTLAVYYPEENVAKKIKIIIEQDSLKCASIQAGVYMVSLNLNEK
jgi:hypothetical protein